MKDGSAYEQRLEYPKGDPENPLSWGELIAKFNALAGQVLPAAQCSTIVNLVRRVDQLDDIAKLVHASRVA